MAAWFKNSQPAPTHQWTIAKATSQPANNLLNKAIHPQALHSSPKDPTVAISTLSNKPVDHSPRTPLNSNNNNNSHPKSQPRSPSPQSTHYPPNSTKCSLRNSPQIPIATTPIPRNLLSSLLNDPPCQVTRRRAYLVVQREVQ